MEGPRTRDAAQAYGDIHASDRRNKPRLVAAGAVAGVASRTVVSPLYRVTVMFQLGDMARGKVVPADYTARVWPSLRAMWTNEGMVGLWRGNGTHMIKKVRSPIAAIKFSTYERYKQLLTVEGVPSGLQRMAAGGMAAFTASVATYPLDLVQTRMTAQTKGEYRSIAHCLSVVLKEDGFIGMYRGLGVALAAVVPYMAMNLSLWEVFKRKLSATNSTEPAPMISAVAGAGSSAVASTVTFPLDLMRRRMQVNTRRAVYTGYGDLIRSIWRNQGILGFYRGCAPHYLTVMPGVAVSMAVYDLMKIMLDIR